MHVCMYVCMQREWFIYLQLFMAYYEMQHIHKACMHKFIISLLTKRYQGVLKSYFKMSCFLNKNYYI